MSGKLDSSLDEILLSQRRSATNNRRRSTRQNTTAKPTPAGGIQKNAKPARGPAAKTATKKPTGIVGESKIVVSNLPKDVSEAQIKDYFNQTVGQAKKVELSYGPGGVSRGIATITFHHADGASKAFAELNGVLIDNRAVKVEVVVAQANLIPKPMTLSQRISQPKAQPKSAASGKHTGAASKTVAAAKGAAKKPARRARNSRPAKKTAEELDSEMADYFDTSAANGSAAAPAASAPAPAPAAGGDAPMEDEIM